jgi:hypothetical protein
MKDETKELEINNNGFYFSLKKAKDEELIFYIVHFEF